MSAWIKIGIPDKHFTSVKRSKDTNAPLNGYYEDGTNTYDISYYYHDNIFKALRQTYYNIATKTDYEFKNRWNFFEVLPRSEIPIPINKQQLQNIKELKNLLLNSNFSEYIVIPEDKYMAGYLTEYSQGKKSLLKFVNWFIFWTNKYHSQNKTPFYYYN